MGERLFTSESVSSGHPDKLCDQISDAILDACISIDPFARVAVETLVKGMDNKSLIVLGGEVTVKGEVPDYEKIANELGRSEYAILLRVIDKILFKNYNDINVDFKDLSLNYNIPSNFLKERFELNNMTTDMVGKKWTD